MQNFIEFELTKLCLVLYSINILTQLETSQVVLNQQFIFYTFLKITSKLNDIVYYIKQPIGLFFMLFQIKQLKIPLPIPFVCTSLFFTKGYLWRLEQSNENNTLKNNGVFYLSFL